MIADNYSQKNHLQLNRVNFPACFNFQKISHLASFNGIFYLENWLNQFYDIQSSQHEMQNCPYTVLCEQKTVC